MTIDKTKITEHAERQLARRQVALRATLEEIDYLEAVQASENGSPEVAQAIVACKTKRDRQHNACLASEGLIAALSDKPTKKTK